ncbi:ALMS1 centrosome and basal body associated protein isoform X2 [Vanacampus margaritifer]
MSVSLGAAENEVDGAGSFQRDNHKNSKLKISLPHSQLQFQDSALSPALALLPANPAEEASVAEYSLFQKSNAEFLPLSASPDDSAAHEPDEGSLSQHPLAQETATSEGETTLTPREVDTVGGAAEVSHITSGSRSTQPDAASELLYRQLLSQSNKSLLEMSEGGTSTPGSTQGSTEQSYQTFLPHSQSTPGVLKLPAKSAVKSGRLSVIPSSDEISQQVDDANPFSDVSLDSDATAHCKLGASSSFVSLEVDNYAPYWNSQPNTPSKQADLNIEDRIPLYLQNLGIDQSPADILTPFAPRGPIREPEFSPTDLSTIKDSAGGTPMKSVSSSEAGSPPKVELSDSYTSLPFSQDGPPVAASLPGQTVTSSSPTDTHQLASDPRSPSLHNPHSSQISGPRARSSLFVVRSPSCSEKPGGGPSRRGSVSPSAKDIVQDTVSSRRAEPEGCSAAPQLPLVARPSTALDDPEPASLPARPPDVPDEASLPTGLGPVPEDPEPASLPARPPDVPDEASLPTGLGPVPEDPENQSAVSDDSGQSSLTVRVAKLLQGESAAASVSDQDDPKHKKRFMLKLSEGRFDSLELDEEDRRRVEEIKAAMLSNNFVTSESSTDTESTATSSAAAGLAPLSDVSDVLPEADHARAEAHVREMAGADVKAHTSITIAARKRPAASSPLTPEPLLQAQLDSASVRKNSEDRKSSLEEEGSANAIKAESSGHQEERDGEEENSRQCHVAEDTTVPFGHVSRAHLTLSSKPSHPTPAPSSSSSSSSVEPPGDKFVPLRRSSPAISSTDEGVGLSSPPPKWDEGRRTTSALAPPPNHHHHRHLHHQSVKGNAMRSYTPETPVRDECAPRASAAPALRPYKPRGADELFYMPDVQADKSSSCTTMESSHTGMDDAVPPLFSAEVLGQQDPGLDRGVDIKHTEGIYSKRRRDARANTQPLLHPGGALASSEKRFPHASQYEVSRMERYKAGGGGKREVDQSTLAPTNREAWLMEQLQRLSDLILATGGADVPPARTYYDETQMWPRRPRDAATLCPADRDESSTTTSTLDTDRLIRAFGSHRVQSAKTPKSAKTSARLHKLYGDVAKQRERWEGRSFNTTQSETTGTEASNVTGESSSTGSYAKTPQHRTSKKPVGRGGQGGDVEIMCNATRLHTRDVGTMFPPPGRVRRSSAKGHVTSLKHKKTRTPPKLPKAMWWFIPLDDSFKENLPEDDDELDELDELKEAEPGPSTLWYDDDDDAAKTARAPLRPRQQLDDDEDVVVLPSSYKSSQQVNSLQEALATQRADFIWRSRQRVQILNVRKNNATLPGSDMPRRAVPRKEMMQRTKQLCERLPEVLRRLEMARRDAQLQLNRLNLQIYNKRITKRRLENRNAVQHAALW